MPMITSAANPKLRYVRHLEHRSFRAREGRLVVEGTRLLREALDAGVAPAFVLVDAAALAEGPIAELCERLDARQVPVLEVARPLFTDLAGTATPQGILAVVPSTPLRWPEPARLVVVLDGVREPGNVGTILRGALAAGFDGALLAPGTADATQAKAVRAGMGAHFRLPYLGASWDEIDRRTAGLALWLADAGGTVRYDAVDWRAPSAVVIGGEASGPSAAARVRARGSVRIPMAGAAESLNAAMAAAVLLFEAARQQGGS
jgi:TrmH family RNA methyltransferase